MSPIKSKLTFAEYLTYDDGTNKRYEFEDGALLEMPPATGKHEAIITLLLIRFYLEIQRLRLPLQVRPSGTEVQTPRQARHPDVCVLTDEQAEGILNATRFARRFFFVLPIPAASSTVEDPEYEFKTYSKVTHIPGCREVSNVR